MIAEFNTVEVRKFNNNCRCKICDNYADEGVYMKSFRLSAQAFHICIPCWEEINEMINDYKVNNNK
jgi:hypothetical protein